MIDFGLDDPQVAQLFARTLAIIDGPITELAAQSSVRIPPVPGTELDRLDQVTTGGPLDVTTALFTSLQAATGSLQQINVLATQAIPTSAIVFQALLRTALVGSARVVYVLLPIDPDVRRDRAAAVLGQDASSGVKALEFYTQFKGLAGVRAPDELLTNFQDQKDALRRQQPGAHDSGVVNGMIEAVVDALTAAGVVDEFGSESLRDHARWLWNTYSGLAHGYSWPRLMWTLSGDRRIPGDFAMDLHQVATVLQIALTAFRARSAPGSSGSKERVSLGDSRRS